MRCSVFEPLRFEDGVVSPRERRKTLLICLSSYAFADCDARSRRCPS
ncbi:hypothetical protein BN2476_70003 [Paraburkholderia piptadeniae]|uniref:Uncharacterized protein n=1 Tax=Paraburkholderia piptadeniae TaxID=1701573 RepID=A0A1N7RL21_9BURK|nr:hypothetical protein BN2476_70003 [Paraburkholderia piptadeniae]